MRIAASSLRPALWRLRITFSRVKRGWSKGGGSWSRTSRPPAIVLELRAS
jgi:hypothetical protein